MNHIKSGREVQRLHVEKPEEYWHGWSIISEKENWVRITMAMSPRKLPGSNISPEVEIRHVQQLTFHKNNI